MNALDPTKGSSNLTSAMMYFNAITDYMTQLRECLGELRDDIEYEKNSTEDLSYQSFSRKIAQEELNAADDEKIAGIVIISFIREGLRLSLVLEFDTCDKIHLLDQFHIEYEDFTKSSSQFLLIVS